jgi:hypothetical protein
MNTQRRDAEPQSERWAIELLRDPEFGKAMFAGLALSFAVTWLILTAGSLALHR